MRPLSNDLQEFIRLLDAEKVEYIIVGAWAVAFHSRPRYTGDLDIFLRRDRVNADRMMRVIEEFGFGATGITTEDFLKEQYVIQLGVEPNRIDLLTGISGVEFEEAWNRRVRGTLGNMEVHFIDRELLIQNKRAADRDKDLGDIRLLERTRTKGA
ncbi:MAG: nucleotidyltransferase [Verrucomicrobia bacterium]|nr:nucleotidyltransferase [Verrucomicrobiota bacterium]